MAYFYSHLIEIESIMVELDELDLSIDQRLDLASLIDETIHHTILDTILSKLSLQDKKIFLELMRQNPKDKKLMEFLINKMDNIEKEIKKTAEELKNELHEDIKAGKKGGKS